MCALKFFRSDYAHALARHGYTFLRNRLPVGGGCVYVLQMFFLFFFVFPVHQKYETFILGNG